MTSPDIPDGTHRSAVKLSVLSGGQIEQVYAATLACLERTGVRVLNAEACCLLADAGAAVDGTRVRIPSRIIEDAVAAAPRSFALWGRDGTRPLEIAPGCSYFGPGPTATYFIDPRTGERRPARRGDPAMTARVADALAHMDYVMGLGLIGDVTPERAPVYEFAEMVANTAKPILAWAFTPANLRDIHRIALAVAGGAVTGGDAAFRARPFYALFGTSQPPLVHTDAELGNALWAATQGIPVIYTGGGSAGATSPVTAAGTLVVCLAAALSGVAVLQLKARGAAVCIGSVPAPTDPRLARPAFGAPELGLYSAALAEIAAWLGLPYLGTAGASEAKTVDAQAAAEGTLQAVLAALSGTTLIHDAGFLDCADLGSLEMLVLTDEIAGMVRRVTRGIEVNEETLALDLIDRIGPGGEYLSAPETARGCRREVWLPALFDRRRWDEWQADGARTANDRLRARVQAILARHQPPPLPAAAAAEIEAVLRDDE